MRKLTPKLLKKVREMSASKAVKPIMHKGKEYYLVLITDPKVRARLIEMGIGFVEVEG